MENKQKTSHWQSLMKTSKERNSYILGKEILSDVIFKFPNNEQIFAHKFELAKGSAKFEEQFFKNLNRNISEIVIENYSKDSCYELIRFIYTDEVRLTDKNVSEIFNLSKEYNLQSLEEKCFKFLDDFKYLFIKFSLSLTHQMLELKEKCISEFRILKSIFGTNRFSAYKSICYQ